MDNRIILPIVIFLCVTYAFKLVVDAYARRKLLESANSPEMIRTAMENEDVRRRQSSLRWGVILVALAVGFELLDVLNLRDTTPSMFAVLLGVTGLGNLIYFFFSRRLR